MKCQNCGADLEDGVLYCRECGAKAEGRKIRFCRGCGSELPEGVKFCGNCGASIEIAANNAAQAGSASANKSGQTKWMPNAPKPDVQVPPTMKADANAEFEGVKDAKTKAQGKGKLIALAAIAIVAVLIIAGIAGMRTASSGQTATVPQTTNTAPTNYKIAKGTQYAFMSDEWNVYIASAVSDSIIKLEHWGKTLSTDDKVGYKSDLGAFKINEPENGFTWLDDEHTAFSFTFSDKDNSYVKKAQSHVFTINISDSDKNKGSDYDADIACYTYYNDDWHMYRAIPLTETQIKIERWSRSFAAPMVSYLFAGDWCVIDTSNTDTDFEWTDDEHTSFTITTKDPGNDYYWKQDTFVVFEQENPGCKYPNVISYLDQKQ